METTEFKFIRLARKDQQCRCCGKGREHICDYCYSRMKQGFSFIIEVKDNATENKIKPTGYAIAFKANQDCIRGTELWSEKGHNIFFMRQAELKQLLGNGYNNYRTKAAEKAKLLSGVGRILTREHAHPDPEKDTRGAAELVHGEQ